MSVPPASALDPEDGTPRPSRRRCREQTREDLRLAIVEVKNKGLKLSISAVASAAGVSPGLIHNTYPDVAEEIRSQIGRGMRQRRDQAATELADARRRMRELREERDAALVDLAKLASINESLRIELATLKAANNSNVVSLPDRPKDRP